MTRERITYTPWICGERWTHGEGTGERDGRCCNEMHKSTFFRPKTACLRSESKKNLKSLHRWIWPLSRSSPPMPLARARTRTNAHHGAHRRSVVFRGRCEVRAQRRDQQQHPQVRPPPRVAFPPRVASCRARDPRLRRVFESPPGRKQDRADGTSFSVSTSIPRRPRIRYPSPPTLSIRAASCSPHLHVSTATGLF
jgi:hypothetical protein